MESFFSHLKVEAQYPYDIRSNEEAQSKIEEFIRFYNEDRAQRKLNKLTPVEYRPPLVAKAFFQCPLNGVLATIGFRRYFCYIIFSPFFLGPFFSVRLVCFV